MTPPTTTLGARVAHAEASEVARRVSPGPPGRFWCGCGVGLLVSLPAAWLLSYGALLPFFIGLFFFAIFGLIIGAAVFRVASPGQPYGRWSVLLGTTLLVGVCWGLAMVKESRDFPTDIASDAVRRVRDIGGRSASEFREHVAGAVRTYLVERYSPGGAPGYFRWSLTNAALAKGDLPGVDLALQRSQGPIGFAIRVVLSIGLLAFGVASQTLTLTSASPRAQSAAAAASPD